MQIDFDAQKWKHALPAEQLTQTLDQVFGAQVRVALEHLHRLVAGDGGDLLVTEAALDQAGDSFMAQVVETQPLDAGRFQCAVPSRPELIGSANTIADGFPPEDQIRIQRTYRVAQCNAKNIRRIAGKWHGSSRAVLRLAQVHGAFLQVHLPAGQ